ILSVLEQHGNEDVCIKDVDAHRGGDSRGVVGRAKVCCLWFLFEADDLTLSVDINNPEMTCLARLDEDGGQGYIGAGVAMLPHHQAVIHLIYMVAGKNKDELGLLAANGVDVLVDGVGGAHVPVLADAFHWRQDLDELADLARHKTPAFADVAIEG